MNKKWCKHCFTLYVDKLASDKHLLLTSDKHKCPECGHIEHLVTEYFKYGGHEVTENGKKMKGVSSRHLGVNPNYSFFENCYPYADVENFHS